MAEYIDRSELLRIEKLLDTDILRKSKTASNIYDQMMYDIAHIPAKDVAAVKHGNWVWDPNGMDFGLGAWKCSECACRNNNLGMNSKLNPLMFSGSKYCPNCGAKMDLEGSQCG